MTIDKGLGYLIIIICVCWAYTQGGIFGSLGVGAVGFVVYDFITQKKSLVAHRRAGFIVRWTAMGNFSIFLIYDR